MKALLTGITGFAGGWLAEHLLAAGDRVLGVSRSGGWLPTSSPAIVDRVPLVRWDLGSDDAPAETAEQIAAFEPDCIYHLAALARLQQCGPLGNPSPRALAVNVAGTRRMLELATMLTSPARLLYVSSSHVYGAGQAGDRPVREDGPLAPRNGYGETKLLAEKLVRREAEAGRIDAVIVRPFQHAGPRLGPGLMLPTWAWQCARGGTGPIWAYNCQARVDMADVRDVVRAYRLLVLRGVRGEVYNVGAGLARQSGEILSALVGLTAPGRSIRARHTTPKFDPIADLARLTACTGWRPEIPLEQTLQDTFDYWRQRRQARRNTPSQAKIPL